MEKIYSKVRPEVLLHVITRKEEIKKSHQFYRRDLCENKEFLQIATISMPLGKTFYPHKHIVKKGQDAIIAQESWIVIEGKIKVILYDINDQIIKEDILMPGDASITFYGGHNYECLQENSLVYEVKSSPYEGVEKDKIKI